MQIVDIQDLLLQQKLYNLIDVDFPPLQTSLSDPEEKYPFKCQAVWLRVD